jgi:hypothetical protein
LRQAYDYWQDQPGNYPFRGSGPTGARRTRAQVQRRASDPSRRSLQGDRVPFKSIGPHDHTQGTAVDRRKHPSHIPPSTSKGTLFPVLTSLRSNLPLQRKPRSWPSKRTTRRERPPEEEATSHGGSPRDYMHDWLSHQQVTHTLPNNPGRRIHVCLTRWSPHRHDAGKTTPALFHPKPVHPARQGHQWLGPGQASHGSLITDLRKYHRGQTNQQTKRVNPPPHA